MRCKRLEPGIKKNSNLVILNLLNNLLILLLMFRCFTIALLLFIGCCTKAQNTSYSVAHDTCLEKKFSIVFHVVLDSNFVPLASQGLLDTVVDTINDRFKRICVTFMNCSTSYLPNYTWGKWKKEPTGLNVIPNYYVENT